MARNLDMTALRSFVAVADSGGVTRAAGALHLTQSAVSMQLKRLEESLDVRLLDRSNRTISLTAEGAQLLRYAREMLSLNDEAYSRLTCNEFEGEVTLGVPHDIIYPYIPAVMRRFAKEFPRVSIKLVSESSLKLRELFGRGECDAILTTEDQAGPGGEVLITLPLLWVGAVGGVAWKQRPLPVAFCSNCIFRPGVLERLNTSGTDWEMVVDSNVDNAVEAVVSADLAVHAAIKGVYPRETAPIPHDGTLPDPGQSKIILYLRPGQEAVLEGLGALIRNAYHSEWAPEALTA